MMNESSDLNSLINRQQIEIDRITILVKNLTLAEQFCVDLLGGKDVFRTSNRLAPEKQQSTPYFPSAIANSPRLNLCLQVWE
ncbi:hypothetical protein IQ272_30255, partial [Chroococcidiopsidales cyanobacterium LEGE 13417]|nr:hypothetical protein [Chroococcidiopsidales cyanobacterium LEGE 13417]